MSLPFRLPSNPKDAGPFRTKPPPNPEQVGQNRQERTVFLMVFFASFAAWREYPKNLHKFT
jgi:hypothetical protein